MCKSDKFWFIVLSGVLVGSVALAFLLMRGGGDAARVYQDGELIESFDLSAVMAPYAFTVECAAGVNVISVENGRIRISDADCPDGSCVRQGWLSGGATPIVCLPHRIVISLERSAPPEIDAVAG